MQEKTMAGDIKKNRLYIILRDSTPLLPQSTQPGHLHDSNLGSFGKRPADNVLKVQAVKIGPAAGPHQMGDVALERGGDADALGYLPCLYDFIDIRDRRSLRPIVRAVAARDFHDFFKILAGPDGNFSSEAVDFRLGQRISSLHFLRILGIENNKILGQSTGLAAHANGLVL